jgi:hypothetical protein
MPSLPFLLLLALPSALSLVAVNISSGPERFYDGKDFYLTVSPGIVVNVFSKASNSTRRPIDNILLNGTASPVSAKMNGTAVTFVLKWEGVAFKGANHSLSSATVSMTFDKIKQEYVLRTLETDNVKIDDTTLGKSNLEVKTHYGYNVAAPLNTAFCCSDPGIFKPTKDTLKATTKYAVGLTFTGMSLQVYGVPVARFGPTWYCGSLIPIGLWVGLIISFLFALVVYYGISMLASIQANDRWDDPKGKPLQVPQHD